MLRHFENFTYSFKILVVCLLTIENSNRWQQIEVEDRFPTILLSYKQIRQICGFRFIEF